MKITSVYVELSMTRSHNYNSCHNMVGLEAELGEGDAPEDVVRSLQKQCHQLLLKKPFGAVVIPPIPPKAVLGEAVT